MTLNDKFLADLLSVQLPPCAARKIPEMVLLHGFIKKTHQTPEEDLDLAMKRKKEFDRDKKAK